MNAHELIREDHEEVRDLYSQFEAAAGEEREELGRQILTALTVHTAVEEELYYPAFAAAGEQDTATEYEAEHAEAKALINELVRMDAADEEYAPTMKALMEAVESHMDEEESEGMPLAETFLSEEDLALLGAKMEARKQELEESTIKRLWASIND